MRISWCVSLPVFVSGLLVSPYIAAQPSYSPNIDVQVPHEVFWGDTHLHTTVSADAFAFGNRQLTPEDAYRFARGEILEMDDGQRAKLSRPLDFLVVADHAEYLGLLPALRRGMPEAISLSEGKRWSRMLNSEKKEADAAGFEILRKFAVATPLGDPATMDAIQVDAWQRVNRQAEQANMPGVFTAFAGYEWSSMPDGNNLHRVIMFRDGADKVASVMPFSSLHSNAPEDLWQHLEDYRTRTGGDAIAIPHNGNVSNGLMFSDRDTKGNPIDRDYASTRAQWESVVEVTQIKGDSEAHPLLSPNDEFADYGSWDMVNITATHPKEEWMLPYEYARSALRLGLEIDARLGINPFQFGMIGSTDSHTTLASAEENNYWGKSHFDLPSKARVQGKFNQKSGGKYPIDNWKQLASGYAGVWALENTREAIFDAMRRREVYATTGPRIVLRFFGGWDYTEDDVLRPDYVMRGYAKGVPMGGELAAAPEGHAPRFMIVASRDPEGANLDRIQVVKGWLDADGRTHEKVYDVAWSGGRTPLANGKLPAVGNTVDLATASYRNSIGAVNLATVWSDPDFDANQRSFYYVRVLEIPTPRWVVYDKVRLGAELPQDAELVHQERAYSSPIWYKPVL